MMRANFLYLGGDKCGSTWIYQMLSRHPDVTLARAKELFYFDRFYHKGPQWYDRQFPPTKNLRIGEICHDYLYSPDALMRIARDMPQDSVFVITLRDPVARSVSHYRYLRKIGATRDSLRDALRTQPQLIEHSMFGKYVALAIQHLGAERVAVLRFEMLQDDPVAFGRALSDALEIPFRDDLPYRDRVLEAKAARNPALVRILRRAGWMVRAAGLPRIVSLIKRNSLVSTLLFSAKIDTPADAILNAEVRAELATLFEDDQRQLQTLLTDMRGLR